MHRTAPDLSFAKPSADISPSDTDLAMPSIGGEPGTIRPGTLAFDGVGSRLLPGLSKLPPPLAATSTRYTAAWAGLGAVSALYLGIVAWQQTQGVEAALVPVTETLERLANDIADLKQATAGVDARERSTAGRVAIVEQRLDTLNQAQVASNAAPAAAPLQPQDQRATNRLSLAATATPGLAVALPMPAAKAAEPAPVAKVTAAAKPKPAVTTAPAPAANPVRTGSVGTSAPQLPQGVLIASGPSLDSVRLSWSVLHQKHGAVLGSLEPRVVPAGDGSAFNLIAGPFASDADAQTACTNLKAQGVGCKAAPFTGAAL